MQFDLEVSFDIDGTFTPGTQPTCASDGTWQPGDSPECAIKVMWRGQDITGLLDAEELQMAEDAWIEHNESAW